MTKEERKMRAVKTITDTAIDCCKNPWNGLNLEDLTIITEAGEDVIGGAFAAVRFKSETINTRRGNNNGKAARLVIRALDMARDSKGSRVTFPEAADIRAVQGRARKAQKFSCTSLHVDINCKVALAVLELLGDTPAEVYQIKDGFYFVQPGVADAILLGFRKSH